MKQLSIFLLLLGSALFASRFSLLLSEASRKFTFLQDASSHSASDVYDYIIVGGGTAGCPLAATLSQKFKVLLLERGGVPYGNPNIERIELFVDNISQCNATSPAQAFVSEDGVLNRRARVLGGGTCLNAGFYSRASKEFITNADWDAKLVEESYVWVEKVVTFVPELKQWQSAVRKGLLEVGILPDNGVSYDHVVGTKTGGSIFDSQGNRHTAADLLEYANAANINVLLHATARKILFHKKTLGGRPKAYGVMYTDSTGTRHHALLNSNPSSEIIVSSGALGSPQLLMLSGIGPKQHLNDFKIPVVLDAAGVGQGMADNPMNAIIVPSPKPLEVSLVEVVGITNFGSFIESASARNASGLASPVPSLLSPTIGMLSSFPPGYRSEELAESVHNQLMEVMRSSPDAASYLSRNGFFMEKVDGPLSSGYLKLRNKNINDNPIVRFNYFANAEDLNKCIRGIQLVEKLIASDAMSSFRYTDISQVPEPMLKLVKFVGNLLPRNTSDTWWLPSWTSSGSKPPCHGNRLLARSGRFDISPVSRN